MKSPVPVGDRSAPKAGSGSNDRERHDRERSFHWMILTDSTGRLADPSKSGVPRRGCEGTGLAPSAREAAYAVFGRRRWVARGGLELDIRREAARTRRTPAVVLRKTTDRRQQTPR
jgi:hypothetical protein